MKITKEVLLRYLELLVNQIPPGKITSYNEIAKALGNSYARKFVYQNIKNVKGPWWRVLNTRLEIKDLKQLELLSRELDINDLMRNPSKYFFNKFKIKDKPLEYLRQLQKNMVSKVILEDHFKDIKVIGGVDLSYRDDMGYVVVVYLDKDLKLLDWFFEKVKIDFPYIPSFLAFREGPAVVKVLKGRELPDILFVNGHGIAHPVKLGLATFVGVELDIPTIGVTKKLLAGKVIDGKIILNNEQVGWVLEKFGNKVYVSPGHKVSLKTSKELSYKLWIRGRYPEPIRLADELSKKVKKVR